MEKRPASSPNGGSGGRDPVRDLVRYLERLLEEEDLVALFSFMDDEEIEGLLAPFFEEMEG